MNFLKFAASIFFFSSLLIAQKNNSSINKYDFGIMAEITSLNYEENNNSISNNYNRTFPISLYLSGRYNISTAFSFEFRPGILVGYDRYQGFEYGFFMRYQLPKLNLYFAGGVNFHKNSTNSKEWLVTNKNIFTLLNLSVGYYIRENFGISLSFYQPTKDYYLYYFKDIFDNESAQTKYKTKLINIVKIGVDYTF